MTDPKVIYLQPECCADPSVGRLWCKDDAPEDCEDGKPWTKYVLADAAPAQAGPLNCEPSRDFKFATLDIEAFKAEAMRLAGAGKEARAALAAHLDKLG